MADVSRSRCSIALKSSWGLGGFGAGGGFGMGVGAVLAAAGGLSFAGLTEDGFSAAVERMGLILETDGLGLAGVIGCDSAGDACSICATGAAAGVEFGGGAGIGVTSPVAGAVTCADG